MMVAVDVAAASAQPRREVTVYVPLGGSASAEEDTASAVQRMRQKVQEASESAYDRVKDMSTNAYVDEANKLYGKIYETVSKGASRKARDSGSEVNTRGVEDGDTLGRIVNEHIRPGETGSLTYKTMENIDTFNNDTEQEVDGRVNSPADNVPVENYGTEVDATTDDIPVEEE